MSVLSSFGTQASHAAEGFCILQQKLRVNILNSVTAFPIHPPRLASLFIVHMSFSAVEERHLNN